MRNKRQAMINLLKSEKYDIMALQETRLMETDNREGMRWDDSRVRGDETQSRCIHVLPHTLFTGGNSTESDERFLISGLK